MGLDWRQLTDAPKDELALLVSERHVAVLGPKEPTFSTHELLSLGRYYGPLHKHLTTGIPKEPGLETVHVVYVDKTRRLDVSAYTRFELWLSYEIQPTGTTIIKVLVSPEPTSRAYQPCIAEPNKPRDLVRQEDILEYDQSKPFSASHHTTKLKSVCVNAGFTRRIIGVLKAESDAIVDFFYSTKSPRIQAFSFGGENNDIVLFDNRVHLWP
ncbi:unnamed protein product [Rhizoctonia solani]|uniref:Uncharacterized protein n=1 Tax=Rhizoctonia solani TaxID=456999 RepID=A0A8H3HCS0_9AGAM|nr:unnamed protein product [Rhizoctonia solani]